MPATLRFFSLRVRCEVVVTEPVFRSSLPAVGSSSMNSVVTETGMPRALNDPSASGSRVSAVRAPVDMSVEDFSVPGPNCRSLPGPVRWVVPLRG
jgi:hypothetical protein